MSTRLPLDSMSTCCTWATNRTSACAYGSTALEAMCRNEEFHTDTIPSNTHTFFLKSFSVLKCSSTACAPRRNCSQAAKPN